MTAAERPDLSPAEVKSAILACLGDPENGTRGSEWRYVCPLHEGAERDSFTINTETSQWQCHACGQSGNLRTLEALMGAAGPGDRSEGPPPARNGQARPRRDRGSRAGWTLTLYDYRDEAGELLYQVVRRDSPPGEPKAKEIRQRRPGSDGGWIANLAVVRLVPYRLPELLAAPAGDPVLMAEGEKACEAIRGLDLVATTNPMGSGKWPRKATGGDRGFRPAEAEAFNVPFAGRSVVILPDNDEPGDKHARQVARALAGVAAEVRILRLPDLPAKGDAADWIEAGGTREALLALAAEAPIEESPAEEGEPDVTEALARLAGMPAIEYERCRRAEAKRLGMRPAVLDHCVSLERAKAAPPADAPPKLIPDLEPWPEPVDGAALLAELQATVRRFVVLSEEAARAVALWLVHTHAIGAADVTPILGITSPEKRCGKSTLLGGLLRRLVRKPLPASNVTPAVVFRVIELHHPTLLVDEADTFLTGKDANEELRGILNSGHTRDMAQILRNDKLRDCITPRAFSTWAAKAIALIGGLPSTLADRAIEIRLMRKLPGETTQKIRHADPDTFLRLARQAARWAEDSIEALRARRPAIPDELHDRAADNWEPLLAIADLAGGPWPIAAREAAVNLSRSASESESLGTRLLADLRTVLAGRTGRVPSKEIVDALNAIEEAAWSECNRGKPLNERKLANLLKPFGLQTSTSNGSPRGYSIAELEGVFVRYLGGFQAHYPHFGHSGPLSPISQAHSPGETVRIEFDPGSPIRAESADSADRNGGGLEVEIELDAIEELIA